MSDDSCIWIVEDLHVEKAWHLSSLSAKKYLEFVSQRRTVSPSWINSHFKRVIGNNQELARNGAK